MNGRGLSRYQTEKVMAGIWRRQGVKGLWIYATVLLMMEDVANFMVLS